MHDLDSTRHSCIIPMQANAPIEGELLSASCQAPQSITLPIPNTERIDVSA